MGGLVGSEAEKYYIKPFAMTIIERYTDMLVH
jgi:hypothetical protein